MSNQDLVPEEQEETYSQFMTLLQASAAEHVPISQSEQALIITRVRERLALRSSTPSTHEAGTLLSQRDVQDLIPRKRARKPLLLVANLLAVLAIIGLLAGSWVLLAPHSSPKTSSVATPETGPTAQTEFGGLEASIHILTRGPYFLSELLFINLSLTNHTNYPIDLSGDASTVNLCRSSAMMAQITIGSNPSFAFPELDFGCAQPAVGIAVRPGQTLTIDQYLPLTRSQQVRLTMGPPFAYLPDPLHGHWPTLSILVNPQIAQSRRLSLVPQDQQVIIRVPDGTQPPLIYMESVTCDHYLSGYTTWAPLLTNTLTMPDCPTAHKHWVYVVGAPGYAIASGSQTA
jgi:hypothetical protein